MLLSRQRKLLIIMTTTGSFFLVEIIVGNMTSSIALVADAFHMLSDVISLIVGFVAIRLAKKNTSTVNSFGWQRAEVVGASINSIFLLGLCFTIFVDSIKRFFEPEEIQNPKLLLIVGSVGLGINIIGLLLFADVGHGHSHGQNDKGEKENEPTSSHSHSHSHSHSDSHSHSQSVHENQTPTTEKSQEIEQQKDRTIQDPERGPVKRKKKFGQNMKSVFLHVLGDALGSVAVIISALINMFAEFEGKEYIDPCVSIIIGAIIVASAFPLAKETSIILLQGVPKLNFEKLREDLFNINGIKSIHELHVWKLSESKLIGSVHIKLFEFEDANQVCAQVQNVFHEYDIHSVTIQPEFPQAQKLKKSQKSKKTKKNRSKEDTPLQNSSEITLNIAKNPNDLLCSIRCKSVECLENTCCPLPESLH